ncbi:hypothetical protein [Nereida sp. NH-UV-3]|uniref:hypothetical protein n=1 Tax=Nereida TaxID=282198 RepID=UPI0036F3A300
MTEVMTLLTSVSGHALVKSFSGTDVIQQPFSTGKLFNVAEEPVSDLQSLSALLQRLENDPKHTVIRGSLVDGKNSPVPRNKEAFTATPRQWCMIDIDSLAWDGDLSDQQAMLSYAIQQLPAEFQSADCWYHLSSSMGIEDGVNVHLWFWLERTCSDNELKTWLSGCPVDMRMFNPIQIHLTANPQFSDGAVDPYPNRSGLFKAGTGVSTVTVPSDLAFRSTVASKSSKQRASGKSGLLDPAGIERDPVTNLAIDGREQLMFLLSNQVMQELVTAEHTPSEEEVTTALWNRFCEEADVSVVSARGPWTIADAASKARARLQELDSGTYDFVSRSDRTILVAGAGKVERPKLVGAIEAQSKLNTILSGFFEDLAGGACPRAAVRLTMGTGKTKQTIAHLKDYLTDKFQQSVEVYVPRHDLADEWEESLEGINARVIHVYPRTGGKWDEDTQAHPYPIMCQRAEYVRDLEAKGHSIYSNACLSRTSGEQCSFFGTCSYLDQFRQSGDDLGTENTIRIYTHASLFLSRNEFERQIDPNLVIIDEAFMSSAVSNMPSIPVGDITQHIRFDGNAQLGFDLVECLTKHQGDLSYLRDKDIGDFGFNAVSVEGLNPATPFSAETTQSRNVRSAKQYKALTKLLEIAAREIQDQGNDQFGQLAYNNRKNEIVICEHKPIRVPRSAPVLYLDATADSIITEAYLPALQYHRIDVHQLAVVSQVHDRTGSKNFWNSKIGPEQENLSEPTYDPRHNDLASLITILIAWVKAGESPLVVGNKDLCEFLRDHPRLDTGVAVAHFMSLRGSNAYEDRSVVFITGRNQPPIDEIEQQARAVFGRSGNPTSYDDKENLPLDQVDYWLSARSPHAPAAMTVPSFSDPRIEAVQKQIREAETVQAIARLRLVWADYQKRVFLLSNLPVEMPVDHLIEFNDLMPDRLEMELIRTGDLPLTPLGLEKMWDNLGLSKGAAKKLFQRSKASDPKQLLTQLPTLVRTATQIATFKAGNERKTTHRHLYLPKDYSGSPTASLYTPWTEAEVLAHLTTGWGVGAITELKLEYLYGPEPEVSG